jgi:hypothetical protein
MGFWRFKKAKMRFFNIAKVEIAISVFVPQL